MKKTLHLKAMLLLLLLGLGWCNLQAQVSVSTGIPSSPSSGSGGNPAYLAFTIENTNSYPLALDSLYMYRGTTSNGVLYSLYYSSTSISGSPGISGGTVPASWTLIDTATQTTVSTTAIHPSFDNLNFTIPANTIYRFAVVLTGGVNVSMGGTASAPNSYSSGGVTIGVGNYQYNSQPVGYWSNNANYFWAGTAKLNQISPCVSPPTAGTATVSKSNPCGNTQVLLNVTGGTGGIGQTYQWQTATSATGPYSDIGLPQSSSNYVLTTPATPGTYYYRCYATCSSFSDTSSVVSITVPTAFPGGVYTINSAQPTSGSNFNNFTDAMNAIRCGITGAITFNVAPGSGPYNEQVYISASVGTSATNTLTINGNGNTLTLNAPASAPYTMGIEGADYITVRDLTIEGTNTTLAYPVRLWNGSDNDSFINCNFQIPLTVTTSNAVAFSASGNSAAGALTAGGPGNSNNVLLNCTLQGGYYGAVFYGASTSVKGLNNKIINCKLTDFYVYAIYSSYQDGLVISNDTVERPTRPTISTFYGMFLGTGNTGLVVENNIIRTQHSTSPVNTNTVYGIYLTSDGTSTTSQRIVNNIIYDMKGNGSHYGIYLSSVDYVDVYHNTVVLDDINSTGGITYGIYNTGTTGGINIKNNLVYISRGGTGNKYCLYYTGAGAKSSNYNDLFITTAATNYLGYNGSNQTTLAAWQAASGAGSPYDANSIDTDPMLANPNIGNLNPTNWNVDDKGTPVGVSSDIKGMSRSATTPDVGAIEFNIPACSGKPNKGVILGPGTVCSGQPFTLYGDSLSIGIGITYAWEYNDGMGWLPTSSSGFSHTVPLGVAIPTSYRVITYCLNSGLYDTSAAYTVTMSPFYLCYCSPLIGNTLHTSMANYTTNVQITGSTLNNTTSVVGVGGYYRGDSTTPTQTATVFINVPFVLNTTQSTTLATVEAWVDWDHSGTFDALEYYSLNSNSTTLATATITPPLGALLGLTGMRIRVSYNSPNAFTSTGACTNVSAGRETEDYLITVAPAPTCPQSTLLTSTSGPSNATLSWTPISGAQQWQVEYGPGTFNVGSGTRATIGLLPFITPTLTYDTSFLFYVRDICGPTDSSTWTPAKKFYLTPPNDDCINAISLFNNVTVLGTTGGATQTDAPCDAGTTVANDVWYKFTTGTTGGSVTITVTTTYADAVVQALDGTCGLFLPMTPTASTTLGSNGCIDGPAAGQEYGTYTVLANTTYYFRVYGYGAVGGSGKEGTFTIVATGTPLAIKLDNITATNIGTLNRIDWNTQTEDIGDRFELERSSDGKEYTTISSVLAKGKASQYSYVDERAYTGINYYRIKMLDASGATQYSKVVTATVKNTRFEVSAFPNPVSDKLTIRVSNGIQPNAQVVMMDIAGKVIRRITISDVETSIDMQGMAKGVYLIKYTDDEHTKTMRISKQ